MRSDGLCAAHCTTFYHDESRHALAWCLRIAIGVKLLHFYTEFPGTPSSNFYTFTLLAQFIPRALRASRQKSCIISSKTKIETWCALPPKCKEQSRVTSPIPCTSPLGLGARSGLLCPPARATPAPLHLSLLLCARACAHHTAHMHPALMPRPHPTLYTHTPIPYSLRRWTACSCTRRANFYTFTLLAALLQTFALLHAFMAEPPKLLHYPHPMCLRLAHLCGVA